MSKDVNFVTNDDDLPPLDFSGIEGAADQAGLSVEDARRLAMKIQHVLSVWPGINLSMIKVGLGITVTSKQWRPIFTWMRQKGYVKEVNRFATNIAQQNRGYMKFFLHGDAAPKEAPQPAAA
jgi:hypothetical protein